MKMKPADTHIGKVIKEIEETFKINMDVSCFQGEHKAEKSVSSEEKD